MIDFHTHVLADFDDGPRDTAESRKLVEELIRQGVTTILSTSHFYPYEESPESFVQRRDEAFAELTETCADLDNIEIIKGAEVYCDHSLKFMNDFSELALDNTPAILLELPNEGTFSNGVIQIIRRLSDHHALTPVIAHVERYPDMSCMPVRKVRKLKSAGCMIQINCDSLVGGKYYKRVRKLMDKGLVDVIGTDCHDTKRRPPHIKQACEIIAEEYGQETLDRLLRNAEELIRGKTNLMTDPE